MYAADPGKQNMERSTTKIMLYIKKELKLHRNKRPDILILWWQSVRPSSVHPLLPTKPLTRVCSERSHIVPREDQHASAAVEQMFTLSHSEVRLRGCFHNNCLRNALIYRTMSLCIPVVYSTNPGSSSLLFTPPLCFPQVMLVGESRKHSGFVIYWNDNPVIWWKCIYNLAGLRC